MVLNDKDFFRLRDFMYSNFGINLAQKRLLIEGRLSKIVLDKGYKGFDEYIDNLMADKSGEEVSILVSKLTTNFTYFMREEHHFDFMNNVALPEIIPQIRDRNLCIWSAGCSSGEEPYTIAMQLNDYFGYEKKGMDSKILATDISQNVLGQAKNGIYTSDRMSKIAPAWYKKYFIDLKNNSFQVKPEIKNEVIFRTFNLMEPVFRFKKKFHIIFCRNVMIYFDAPTREKLAQKFYDTLVPGGYLFIGMSETLLNSSTKLDYIKPAIYQKAR